MSSLFLSIYTIASGEQFWRKKKLVGKKKWSKRFILRSLARSPYDTTGCSLSIRLHMSQRSFKQKHFNIQRCLLFKAKTKGKFVSRKGIHEQSKFSKWMKRKHENSTLCAMIMRSAHGIPIYFVHHQLESCYKFRIRTSHWFLWTIQISFSLPQTIKTLHWLSRIILFYSSRLYFYTFILIV